MEISSISLTRGWVANADVTFIATAINSVVRRRPSHGRRPRLDDSVPLVFRLHVHDPQLGTNLPTTRPT